MKRLVRTVTALFLLMLFLFTGPALCAEKGPGPRGEFTIATTTSLADTGLLDSITDRFTKKTGIKVKAVSSGSGQAIAMGTRGDADLLIVHSEEKERQFIKEGYGKARTEFMFNYFLIAGPEDDPAGIKSAKTPAEAFRKIAEKKCPFLSRADNSGTNEKEKYLWKSVKINPGGSWYSECGSGMAQALLMASEKRAYILSDEATFAVMRKKTHLAPYHEKNPSLKNIYSVILVNPTKFPAVHGAAAEKFREFILSKECQTSIKDFKDKEGRTLFIPLLLKES
jgi:tungstate transport system substrate-binding protein